MDVETLEKNEAKTDSVEAKPEILEDKKGEFEESKLIKERGEKIVSFLKSRYSWITYIILAIIVWIAVRIRTRNIGGLRDVTTGTWTLGPDLDPFLFLRWSKHIVETGTLMALDTFRYVPLGYETKGELILLPYLMAWFHNFASVFGSESVTQSAVFFPVFMFALTVVAFFFMVRKIFIHKLGKNQANAIALVSSFFLSVLPALLPRTIAGIPEKESAAFFFLFMTFYLFLSAWDSKKRYKGIILAILAGASTAAMALIWGGFAFIFLTLSASVMLAFLLGKIDMNKFWVSLVWLISSFALMIPFSTRYSINNLLFSVDTGSFVFVVFVMVVHITLTKTKLKKYLELEKISKIPKHLSSLIVSLVLALIAILLTEGPGFISSQIVKLYRNLVKPAASRLLQTVAENRQPYFSEWAGNFGPHVAGFPILFWLFFIGSVYLFFNMVKMFRTKERWILSGGYLIFISAIIFSRYRADSILNGENFTSIGLYLLGVAIFIVTLAFFYYKYHKSGEFWKLRSVDFGLLILFSFFVLGILGARGLIRLVMMLVPSVSIIVSYFAVSSLSKAWKKRESKKKLVSLIVAAIIVLATVFAGYQMYLGSNGTAGNFIPSGYTQQWQRAMGWVRENTQPNSVFIHWWDYGYWVQSLGERATVLDGGNSISYWNHFMGRHGLTGPIERDALEFFYTHDVTHFLIDSTDIGKYTAFSTIGSDENYDRRSWINTLTRDNSQIFESKDSVVMFFTGGVALDEDVVYQDIFLPGLVNSDPNKGGDFAGLGAVRIEIPHEGTIEQPIGVFVYRGVQHELPLRYAFHRGERIDFGSGVEAGVFLMPRLVQNHQGVQVEQDGAMLFLTKRTVNSQLAKLYLYGEESEFFDLVHKQDDFVLASLKEQGLDIGDFAQFQGLRGPIKIWEVSYPADIETKEEFLETKYPESLTAA